MGKKEHMQNGKWILATNKDDETYEDKMSDSNFNKILSENQAGALVFNYPGVGASSGLPNKQAMAKAYQAMLSFLEDKEKGIGATEIIGYNSFIGKIIQQNVLKTHTQKNGITYQLKLLSDDSSPKTASKTLFTKLSTLLTKVLGWEFSY